MERCLTTENAYFACCEIWAKNQTADVSEGITWYANARSWIVALSHEHAYSFHRIAGAVAVMSQRARWSRQQAITRDAIALTKDPSSINEHAFLKFGLRKSHQKAWNILLYGDIDGNVSGQKIECFYQNLIGNELPVTVDVWMFRGIFEQALKRRCTRNSPTVNEYRICANAISKLAGDHGYTPAQTQAVLWAILRRREQLRLEV